MQVLRYYIDMVKIGGDNMKNKIILMTVICVTAFALGFITSLILQKNLQAQDNFIYDINKDGNVTILDLLKLQKYIVESEVK